MSIEQLISTYGYAAIGIGTFFEGETVLVLAGFAAHRGYLDLKWVILSALLGTLLGDQFYFYVGRAKGKEFIEKRPAWKSKAEKVFSLMARHQLGLIFGFRFLYGLRSVTPFLLGASKIEPFRFLIMNFIGALVWAVVIGTMGYLFGHSLEIILGQIKRYELLSFAMIAFVGTAVWSVYLLSKRKKSGRQADSAETKSRTKAKKSSLE